MKVNDLRCLFEYRSDGTLWWRNSKQGRETNKPAGTPDKDGYCLIVVDGTRYRGHDLVYRFHGYETDLRLDHINGNPSDNRVENLRPATVSLNGANRKVNKGSRTGYKGVTAGYKGKFNAVIVYQKQSIWLGSYLTAEEAAAVYNAKALELFGEYAKLNNVKEAV